MKLLLHSSQLAQMLLLVNEEIQNKDNLHNPLRLPYLLLMKLAPRIQLPLRNLRLKEDVSLLQSLLLPALVHLLNVRLKLLILRILIQLAHPIAKQQPT